MSETVHYKGKLKQLEKLENETLEEQCKRLLDNQELESYYDSYREMLLSEYYNQFLDHNGILFSVTRECINPHEDIFRSSKNEDGTIDFEVKYYNGGCGFSEAIEEALSNIKL